MAKREHHRLALRRQRLGVRGEEGQGLFKVNKPHLAGGVEIERGEFRRMPRFARRFQKAPCDPLNAIRSGPAAALGRDQVGNVERNRHE